MRKHLLFLLIIFLSHLMIERYNRIIARVDRFQAVIDLHQQVAFGILIIGKRHNNVENQVDLAFAVHYAEVVHGKLSVDLTEHAVGLLTQRVDIRISASSISSCTATKSESLGTSACSDAIERPAP